MRCDLVTRQSITEWHTLGLGSSLAFYNIDSTCGFVSEIDWCIEYVWAARVRWWYYSKTDEINLGSLLIVVAILSQVLMLCCCVQTKLARSQLEACVTPKISIRFISSLQNIKPNIQFMHLINIREVWQIHHIHLNVWEKMAISFGRESKMAGEYKQNEM